MKSIFEPSDFDVLSSLLLLLWMLMECISMALEERATNILTLAFFLSSWNGEKVKSLTWWEYLMMERQQNSSDALSSSGSCDSGNSGMRVGSSYLSLSSLLLLLRILCFFPFLVRDPLVVFDDNDAQPLSFRSFSRLLLNLRVLCLKTLVSDQTK